MMSPWRKPGLRRRAAFGDAHDHDLAIALGRKGSEPRARRLADLSAGQQIVEDRRQQIDRHDHVDVGGLAVPAHLQPQRADAQQLAVRTDQRRAAPPGMGGRDEDRLVQQILPIAGEFLLGDDGRLDRPADPVGQHHGIAQPRFRMRRPDPLPGGRAGQVPAPGRSRFPGRRQGHGREPQARRCSSTRPPRLR